LLKTYYFKKVFKMDYPINERTKIMKKLKKLNVIFMAILMILWNVTFLDVSAGDDLVTTAAVNVEVEIESVFGFKIGAAESDQKLYPLSEEEAKRKGKLNIEVTTNRGTPWVIRAESEGLYSDGQTGYGTPLVISTYGDSLKGGTVKDMQLTPTPKSIYTAGSNERYVDNFLVESDFEVKKDAIPFAVGTYTGSIKLTMTETAFPR
jgi:hypothetical protein